MYCGGGVGAVDVVLVLWKRFWYFRGGVGVVEKNFGIVEVVLLMWERCWKCEVLLMLWRYG